MLYREIIAVCSQIHTKHTNTLCVQNWSQAITAFNVTNLSHLSAIIFHHNPQMQFFAIFFYRGPFGFAK